MGKYTLGKIHSKYLIIDILSCPYVDSRDFGRKLSQIARTFRQLLLENYQFIKQLSYETTLLSESEVKTLKRDDVT